MRLVYMGTPRFAVPTLEAILKAGHEVALVLTQPDRPKGRGRQLAASPVKECALAHGIRVEQPDRVRRPEMVDVLRGVAADAMVVVGYGQLIPQSILDLPALGIINVHASLLPKYRGAGPIQWAIANGERTTGVTTMRIDAGLDTGDILLMRETEIGEDEDAIALGNRLAVMGAELLVETLAGLGDGSLAATPQDHASATLAPMLKKEDGRADWKLPAQQIHCRLRGFQPWPGCYTTFRGMSLHITQARLWPGTVAYEPGRMWSEGGSVLISCGGGTALEVLEVQLAGRRRMAVAAFLNGQRLVEYEMLA
ncbi:MAG: methionyl-tRNA formyltransferase [Candidatus Solibacter usitatus]|nr:methionyl-tRNA formyltransferase [Candidatus Solibacter usitatus]